MPKWVSQDPRTGQWVDYTDSANRMIEAAFQHGHRSIDIDISGRTYKIDFTRQRQQGPNGTRSIRREATVSNNPYEIDYQAPGKVSTKELEQLFNKYKEASKADEDCIQGEGLIALCNDLGVSIDKDNDTLLVLACKIQAQEPWKIGRTEFVQGLRVLGVDGLKKLKAEIPRWKDDLANPKHFKYFYWFIFDWTREEPESRVLQNDYAVESWNIFLRPRVKGFPIAEWCEYVSTHYKKAISRDVWKSLLDLINTIDPDLSNYSESDGWPVVMDDFVEWIRAKRGGGS